MGAWLKLFKDGTDECGSDKRIAEDKASWSRGQLDNIKEVKLFNIKQEAALSIPNTSWHQFDRYQVTVVTGKQKSEITHRVIQAEIKPHHINQFVVCFQAKKYTLWAMVQDLKDIKEASFFYTLITKDHIGKWFTVILPEKGEPTMSISTRGKMHDNQHISRQRN